jgi:hypothetical protein
VTITETLERVDQKTLKERVRIPFLVGLVAAVLGSFLALDLPPLMKSTQAMSWKQVPGITRRAGLSHMVLGRDPAWRPIVVYHYTVDGKAYVNDTISFQEWLGLPGFEAGQIRTRYIPGTAVTVSYNPADPQDACLEPEPRYLDPFMHLVCYIMLAALIFLSCYPPVKPEQRI